MGRRGWVLLRRAALPDGSATRLKVRSMVGLLPLCATTVIEPWQRERAPRMVQILRNACAACPNCSRAFIQPALVISGMAIAASLPGESGTVAPDSVAYARRERIPQSLRDTGTLPLPRRASLCLQCGWPGISGELSPGRIGHRHVRWKLQLARSDMDAGERTADPRLDVVLFVLRRQLQDRVSDWFGQLDEPV